MSQVKRLGMGLGALIGGAELEPRPLEDTAGTLEIASIRPNPYQPRAEFDEADTRTLADSIRKQGLLQPVVVRKVGEGLHQLVAGERRFRAARMAGLARIPVVLRDVDDKRMLELALVENLQRKDLNPIEKARAFRQLMQLNDWTQEALADAVGLGRPTVANFLRLLELPAEVQEAVSRGTISMGHARALLGVGNRATLMQVLRRIVEEDLSVRAVEKLVSSRPSPPPPARPGPKEPYLADLEQKLMDKLGFRAEIMPEAIVIPYGSNSQLTAILRRLGVL